MASLEKAIDIKRRAQRCILNGDLDGALAEYEKLAALENADPYNFVLLADLTFKRGDHEKATERYLQAADSYEKAGLYKNAIAVCKKMMRLKLSAPAVLKRLAGLHALDGLATEAALYWMQYAEYLSHENRYKEAAESLRQAFGTCPENIGALEKLAEVLILDGDNAGAARALAEASSCYARTGAGRDAERCSRRAEQLERGAVAAFKAEEKPAGVKGAEPDARTSGDWTLTTGSPAPTVQEGVIGDGGALEAEAPGAPVIERLSTTDFAGTGRTLPGLETSAGRDIPATTPPAAPGLGEAPAAVPAPEPDHPSRGAAVPRPVAAARPENIAAVEALLKQAEQEFRSGDRDAAARTLMGAARGYEELDKLDSAAVIYRSLSKSPNPPPEAATRWFENAERRGARSEAAQIACEIGDRILNDGDQATAAAWFERARELDASNDHALRRLARLGGGAAPAPAPADSIAPAPPPAAPIAPPPTGSGKLEVAMGNIDAVAPDLSALLAEFQRGVESLIADDAQGNYDLGMAYREMGLLDQAVECFRVAARNPQFSHRCAEMIGRSLLDQGMFDDAAEEFRTALGLPGLDPAVSANLRYQLGLAHEAAGRAQEALGEFERVYAQQPSYPDVAQKIRVLRRALESV